MAMIELEYSGEDLVISKEIAEKKLGLHLGDRIEVRPKLNLITIKRSSKQSHQITESLERFRDAFDPSELEDWETQRTELWSKWQVPT